MKKHYWTFLFLLFVVVAISACGKVQDPQFRRIEHFGLKHFSLQEATVGFDITYYNPNSFGVAVKEAALDIYIDSFYLGKFQQLNNIAVSPTAEFSIPLEGKISIRQALNSQVQKLAGKEVLVRAGGAVKVGKAGVFISKDINYSGRHVLDLGLLKNPAAAGLNLKLENF